MPKVFKEAARFITDPGFPPLELTQPRLVGGLLQFEVLNHTPLVLLATVGIRYRLPDGFVWSSNSDIILPFGRDEWQAEVPAQALEADLRASIWPLEIAFSQRVVGLTTPSGSSKIPWAVRLSEDP